MCLPINYYSLSYQLCMLHCVHGLSFQNETDYLYYKFFFCGTSRILHMQFNINFFKTHNNAKRFTNRLVTKELQTYQPWIMVRYNCLHFFFFCLALEGMCFSCLGSHVTCISLAYLSHPVVSNEHNQIIFLFQDGNNFAC